MSFHVTSIPHAMRRRGWLNGARLLERWFSLPPHAKPDYYPVPDLTTIRMDEFVLTYPRARAVYDRLVAQPSWTSQRALNELTHVLRRKGLLSDRQSHSFGEEVVTADVLHRDHITHREFDDPDYGAPRDDLTAALHDFSFYLAPYGVIEPIFEGADFAGRRIEIRGLRVWLKDSFDFENPAQPLGDWDLDHALLATEASHFEAAHVGHYETVSNASFQWWRWHNNRGGDFEVFSDVKRVALPTPYSFRVPA
jgi:hypothetical protein